MAGCLVALVAGCTTTPAAPPAAAPQAARPGAAQATPTTVRPASVPAKPASTTIPPAPTPTATPTTVVSSAGFVHPGVLLDATQIATVKARLAAKQQPWTEALAATGSSGGSSPTAARPESYSYGALDYPPKPVRVLQAPSAGTADYLEANPQLGLTAVGDVEHLDDARAAYTHALRWIFTGNPANARKAIEIMNAWSSTLTEIKFDQPRRPDNNGIIFANGKLQASWGAELFARAAELVRYSGAGWAPADVARFSRMLTNVYLPLTIDAWRSGANWLMSSAEATIEIGVFTDDRAAFDAGVALWRRLAPSTIYMPSDGPTPIPPAKDFDTPAEINALWYGPTRYLAGLQGETLRDMSHMMMGLGALSNAAETARIQGVDLYGEQRARIVAGYELNAGYVREYLQEVDRLGGAPPSSWRPSNWVGGAFNLGGLGYQAGWEVAYSHYAGRLGISMPNTKWVVERLRPSGPALHMTWETLTHAS